MQIQGMHASVADEKLEERVFDIFGCLGIEEEGADIKDCHRLGYASNKNTIIRFVNRKFFYQALGKKFELYNLDSERLCFNPIKKFHFSENFIPHNQLLVLQCGELKRVSVIHSTWSAQGAIRIRRTANERAHLIICSKQQ